MRKEISSTELEFLLRFPVAVNVTTPVDFLSNHSWGGIKVSGNIYHILCDFSVDCDLKRQYAL